MNDQRLAELTTTIAQTYGVEPARFTELIERLSKNESVIDLAAFSVALLGQGVSIDTLLKAASVTQVAAAKA